MTYKPLKHKTILVTKSKELIGLNPSDELHFTVIRSIGKSTTNFEEWKKACYLFFNFKGNYIKRSTINNKIKQLLTIIK